MTEDIDTIPDDSTVEETAENMRERGFEVIVAENSDEALDEIKDLIEKGSEVQWGSSTTLSEIGFEEWIEDADVENLKQEIWSIDDDEKRSEARRESVTADNFLGGINAISREGQLVQRILNQQEKDSGNMCIRKKTKELRKSTEWEAISQRNLSSTANTKKGEPR